MPFAAPTPPKRPLWKQPKAWAIGIVALLVLSAIGSLGKSEDEPAATGSIRITSHATGDIVESAAVTVEGTAPAGAKVIRDVSFGSDQKAVTTADGTWAMLIELEEGTNELTFRIGSDRTTEVSIGLEYVPKAAASVPVASEPAAQSAAPSSEVTPEPTETAASEPTPDPTEAPTPEPTPEPTRAYATFDDGTWVIGSEIAAGTYRTREPVYFCYWARLKGFGGSLDEIIANDNVTGYAVVSIASGDAGFESSGCGTWSKDLSRVTDSKTRFGEGTFIVGTDIKPGTYAAPGGDGCYWARLKNFRGSLGGIIANGLPSGRAVVTIKSTDKGFESAGCGDWVRR